MPGISTEYLAEQIKETNQRLERTESRFADAIERLREATQRSEVQVTEINVNLRYFRKIGWTLAGCALGVLGSSFYAAYRAGQIEGTVIALQKDSGRIEGAVLALQKDSSETKGAVLGLQKDSSEIKGAVLGLQKDIARVDGAIVATRKDSQARGDRLVESLGRIEKALAQPRPK